MSNDTRPMGQCRLVFNNPDGKKPEEKSVTLSGNDTKQKTEAKAKLLNEEMQKKGSSITFNVDCTPQ